VCPTWQGSWVARLFYSLEARRAGNHGLGGICPSSLCPSFWKPELTYGSPPGPPLGTIETRLHIQSPRPLSVCPTWQGSWVARLFHSLEAWRAGHHDLGGTCPPSFWGASGTWPSPKHKKQGWARDFPEGAICLARFKPAFVRNRSVLYRLSEWARWPGATPAAHICDPPARVPSGAQSPPPQKRSAPRRFRHARGGRVLGLCVFLIGGGVFFGHLIGPSDFPRFYPTWCFDWARVRPYVGR